MTDLPLGKGAYRRTYALEPEVQMINRFFEPNPSNRVDGVGLLSRPGTTIKAGCGTGPIRTNFWQQGCLNGYLFTCSGAQMFQFDQAFNKTALIGTIANSPAQVSMCGTDKLWIADGTNLWFWDGVGSRAKGVLTFAANPLGGNTVTVGGQTYKYVLQLTATSPVNSVLVGAAQADSIANLVSAVNAVSSAAGATYATGTTVNSSAVAVNNFDGTVTFTAKTGGTAGNATATVSALGGAYATSTLTFTPGVVATQSFQIDGFYYVFTTTPTSNPLAAGTSANPWQVYAPVGASATQALLNLAAALNGTGTAGTTYSTALTAHPTVYGVSSTATALVVNARSAGTAGNAISTTIVSGAGFAWTGTTLAGGTAGATGFAATTLQGGVNNALSQVSLPAGYGALSVDTIGSFVLVACANSNRMYYLRPGSLVIDPLDFFSAEATQSNIIQLITVGDQIWILKADVTQAVYLSGDSSAPFAFITGRAFAQGVQAGTAVILNQEVYLVGNDDVVYRIAGRPRAVSDNGISERIRKARAYDRDNP